MATEVPHCVIALRATRKRRHWMTTCLLDEIAAVTASLGAARQAALSAELLSAVRNLANVCEHVLQPSRLLRLPPEMLLRVMRELDARTLANLGATMHNFPLLDCACDEAAEAQHGHQLAVLRPQRLTAPRRLRALEEAIEQGSDWGDLAANHVPNDGDHFNWPDCTLFNEDIGKLQFAVLMSASANSTIKRMAAHGDTQTGQLEVDSVHKSAIHLAARLATGAHEGCGVRPMAKEDAVDFLTAQLNSTDKRANVTYVRRTARSRTCLYVHHEPC